MGEPGASAIPSTAPRLRIGIICYPTMGGSGIIATEIGLALARAGHQVHFICADVPARLRPWISGDSKKESSLPGLFFHAVEVDEYLLPHMGSYPLALAARLAQVTREHGLDIWHLHYAVPHAVSALLARQLLAATATEISATTPVADHRAPPVRTVLTLHGTDVTGVGSSPSLREINRFALLACDALTVPSQFLKAAVYEHLNFPAKRDIAVIPNFVDTQQFRPASDSDLAAGGSKATRHFTLCHASNFRPLKRIDDVIHTFAAVKKESAQPVRLLLVGEGPERPRIEALVASLDLTEEVAFLGFQPTLNQAFQHSDVFLLPSQSESFGLAALEALSCGLPVVASRVGGIPEVVQEGETGLLFPVGDVAGMAGGVLQLISDRDRHARMQKTARQAVIQRFQREPAIAEYEACYRRLLAQ